MTMTLVKIVFILQKVFDFATKERVSRTKRSPRVSVAVLPSLIKKLVELDNKNVKDSMKKPKNVSAKS